MEQSLLKLVRVNGQKTSTVEYMVKGKWCVVRGGQ